ncbi:hypothetical protein JMJ77_0015246 [Colletotrichum scovillei]|uniref:Uncharacterized protein n=1 Tax=Colletotrichum scovillei TaxID=1209932 RepID=A0A9P7R3R6_9PEZI|nr:hypothetical protein JMJ77_0015246 [Colletotrichum scovillei]KAG7056870.1 hypothetical protein JMJ78_0000660 [Colletotrichum scovillei]KAG7066799.1 hypothetical protein JMJ76_0000650 [Colletotrichum scovillei]
MAPNLPGLRASCEACHAASDSGSSNTREIDALLGSTSPRISSPLNAETFAIHPELIDLEDNQGQSANDG